MSDNFTGMVMRRQEPLRQRYRDKPGLAQIADHARSASAGLDPFHGAIVVGDSRTSLAFGIHRAVGGDHDLPNPGDMLCAAPAKGGAMDASLHTAQGTFPEAGFHRRVSGCKAVVVG